MCQEPTSDAAAFGTDTLAANRDTHTLGYRIDRWKFQSINNK